MTAPLVIVDRDGVINQESKDFIRSAKEWVPIPGSIEALARLSQAGYRIIVATNQSGLTRGLFSAADLEAMHAKLRDLLCEARGEIEAIFVCPDLPPTPEDRKQRLFARIGRELQADLAGIPAIGDSLRDIQAALDTGARPILVRTGNGRLTEQQLGDTTDVEIYEDLAAAVDALLDEPAR
jgi:D-glycero-D-manno-heptose 1,7-bisphosphate phosphatase